MDVTCERCGTEYEFDETLLSGRGTSVKCTNCGHVFKVYPRAQAEADRATSSWRLRLADGSIDMIDSLRELQRRIGSNELTPANEISRGDEEWKTLGSIPELETFFQAAGVPVPPQEEHAVRRIETTSNRSGSFSAASALSHAERGVTVLNASFDAVDIRWYDGWATYGKGDYELAAATLSSSVEKIGRGWQQARGLYWTACALEKAGKDDTLTYLKTIRLPEIDAIAEREWEIHLTNLALENIDPLFSGKAVDAFRLTLEGKSVKEIAQKLDLKENSVYRLKNRVKERLVIEIQHLRNELESV